MWEPFVWGRPRPFQNPPNPVGRRCYSDDPGEQHRSTPLWGGIVVPLQRSTHDSR